MRKTVGPEIRCESIWWRSKFRRLEEMIEAGATRIGASSGVEIMKG